MARKPVYKYKNPKAPVDQGGDKKPFVVDPGSIISGEDKFGAMRQISGAAENEDDRVIMLTETMAKFHGNLGQIVIEMDFGADKDKENAQLREDLAKLATTEDENAALRRQLAELEAKLAGSETVPDPEPDSDDAALSAVVSSGDTETTDDDADKADPGDTADSSGGKSGNGRGKPATNEAAKPARRTRRKTL